MLGVCVWERELKIQIGGQDSSVGLHVSIYVHVNTNRGLYAHISASVYSDICKYREREGEVQQGKLSLCLSVQSEHCNLNTSEQYTIISYLLSSVR